MVCGNLDFMESNGLVPQKRVKVKVKGQGQVTLYTNPTRIVPYGKIGRDPPSMIVSMR